MTVVTIYTANHWISFVTYKTWTCTCDTTLRDTTSFHVTFVYTLWFFFTPQRKNWLHGTSDTGKRQYNSPFNTRVQMNTQYALRARFMGPTWGQHGSCRPHAAPYRPHEPCYLGRYEELAHGTGNYIGYSYRLLFTFSFICCRDVHITTLCELTGCTWKSRRVS